MPFGCSATLRSLSHFLQLIRHSSRQLLCPSRHFVHYFLRYASLHLVRSLTICCKARHPFPYHKSKLRAAPAFPQASPTILTGFHSASFVATSFQLLLSPPAAHNLARRPPHFGCVHLATANCSCRTSISQSIAKVHLHSSAASVP